jgi:heptosyltransferase-2
MQPTILIIHQGAIGDLVLSLPALHAIRSAFPGQRVEVMGYPTTLSLIHKRFYADGIASIDRAGMASLYVHDNEIASDIQAYLEQFERIYVFGGRGQEVLVNNMRSLLACEVRRIPCVPNDAGEHVVDFQLRQLGLPLLSAVPRLFLLPDDFDQADRFLELYEASLVNQPLVAVHPGSGGSRKNWPAAHFAAFMGIMQQRTGCTFLVISGPADAEPVQQLMHQIAPVPVIVARELALPVLAAVLGRCRLFVGNDSGITHIAAAMGTGTLAFFGSTDQAVWGPRGERVCIMGPGSLEQASIWASPDEAVAQALGML